MQDEAAPPAVIEYARVSADDEKLGRYLRVILGSTVLFYGGTGVVAATMYYATVNGWLLTTMKYGTQSGGAHSIANAAAVISLMVAGPLILWGRRGAVAVGGLLVRIASILTVLSFVASWAMTLTVTRTKSPSVDGWYWFTAFVANSAYLSLPILTGLLAKSPAFTRIRDVATP